MATQQDKPVSVDASSSQQQQQQQQGEKKAQESPSARVRKGSGEKIIDKIERAMAEKRVFYSFEYFPPKTEAGVRNLYARLDRMATLEPLFMDVTWGAGGTTADLTLEISSNAQNYCAADVMMHLTCTNMPQGKVDEALEAAKKAGIRNILALRGDPPKGQEWQQCEDGFAYAVDLVKYIRSKYGDYFGIGVAGYPEGHIAAESFEKDLQHLKEKVDAGADFIITQLFYDVDLFLDWMKKARAIGIKCPIVPGLMPIQAYGGFKRMTGFCKTHVPQEILNRLEPIKDDDDAVKQYGIELCISMCRRLVEAGVPGLHFYTLNLERSVTRTLEGLGYVAATSKNALPWAPSRIPRRQNEDVRPIFWANRPTSYLDRTTTWDDFPNGRWGDARSPAFGDLSDYHLSSFATRDKAFRRKIWGEEVTSLSDITKVFVGYVEGEVPQLPWSENALQLESMSLKSNLRKLCHNGFLTINSQPRVNGVPSTDDVHGWGGEGGYVFQKAYTEFFCSPQRLKELLAALKHFPTITYQAVDASGRTFANVDQGAVNAVTWGVFPGKEIIQPTIVDPSTFLVWKDEAFALWENQWQSIYDAQSASHKFLQEVHDTFFLVNMVDNNFVNGNIFAVFDAVVAGTYPVE
eukprot:TRINITY_DN65671_c11_g10_i1.p1 TRINITY_DN65671_c11_g10~~TRINITY_DN65671_c11_g10_i1.p1  ORF type:complete len:650 (-),score=362.60 TRINITY_DN65671_c11_g10_i1:68-1969(-)